MAEVDSGHAKERPHRSLADFAVSWHSSLSKNTNHRHFTDRHQSACCGKKQEDALLLREKEENAREYSKQSAVSLFFLDNFSSLKVFCQYLITLNSIFGAFLTVAAIVWVYIATNENESQFLGSMDWVLLGFAVVLPLSASVRFAFLRREQALISIAQLKSNSLYIYLAHASWDWEKKGSGGGRGDTKRDWLEHSDKVFEELIGIGDELCRYLTMPTSSNARHRELRRGRMEAATTMEASYLLFDSLLTMRIARLSDLTEKLKYAGLPATEASRIRQLERFMCLAMEELRMLKTYRTPQALRSFANIFALFLPPLYAPSFVQLANNVNSLAIGIVFGVITSLALTALYESVHVLEDPFVACLTLDGIDVYEELAVLYWRQLVNARKVHFPDASPIKEDYQSCFQECIQPPVVSHEKSHRAALPRGGSRVASNPRDQLQISDRSRTRRSIYEDLMCEESSRQLLQCRSSQRVSFSTKTEHIGPNMTVVDIQSSQGLEHDTDCTSGCSADPPRVVLQASMHSFNEYENDVSDSNEKE